MERRPGPRASWEVPDAVWGPIVVGSLLGAVGLIGLAAGQPWLLPSLGPTAYLVAEEPRKPSSRFYNTVVGHLVGLGSGVLAVIVLGATAAPAVLSTGDLTPSRVGAAVLAAVVTMAVLPLIRASHPPAAATMLLVALGSVEPTWKTAGHVLAGAAIVGALGEGFRWLRRDILPAPRSEEAKPGA